MHNHSIEHEKILHFTSSKTLTLKDLTVSYSLTNPNSGWTLVKLDSPSKVKVYPLNNNEKDLKFWSQNFSFPPSFKLQVLWNDPTSLMNDIIKVAFSSPDNSIEPVEIVCPLSVRFIDPTPSQPVFLSPLPSASPQRTILSNSKEYKVFLKHFVNIIDSVHFDVKKFCDRLFSCSLIDAQTFDKIYGNVESVRDKTSRMIKAVCMRIKEDRSAFWVFLKALAEKSPHYQSGGECLLNLYNKLYCAYRPNILIRAFTVYSNALKNVLKSTTLTNAVHFLTKNGIQNISESADSVISGIINELKRSDDPYQVFLDVCSVLRTRAEVNLTKLQGSMCQYYSLVIITIMIHVYRYC